MIDALTDLSLLTVWLVIFAAPTLLLALFVAFVVAFIEKIFGDRL